MAKMSDDVVVGHHDQRGTPLSRTECRKHVGCGRSSRQAAIPSILDRLPVNDGIREGQAHLHCIRTSVDDRLDRFQPGILGAGHEVRDEEF